MDRPDYKVVGDRPLKFCSAIARGSVSKPFVYGTESGAEAMTIILQDLSRLKVYVNGGPSFHFPTTDPAVSVLATYESTNEPAIIKCSVGLGWLEKILAF